MGSKNCVSEVHLLELDFLLSISDRTVFISKTKATLSDFLQLFEFFEESWKNFQGNAVIFGLGSYDISKANKELSYDKNMNEFDFHPAQNDKNSRVSNRIAILVESLREIRGVNFIVTLDPVSRESSGYHNAAVDFCRRRATQIDDKHFHLISSGRLQRNEKKCKNKSRGTNFPCISEKFASETELVEKEKNILVGTTLKVIKQGESNNNNVFLDREFVKRKF